MLREGDTLVLDVTLPAESWDETVLWTVSDGRGDAKAGTLPLRDTPVIAFRPARTTTLDTRRVTLPFTVAVRAVLAPRWT